ncbi:MAG TPA: NTP transferase domain-containing protein [Saprospiraceae bacterium]|nr:NTP transferase domain-containing protein [Saprospiraceae bacterium]
MDEKQGHQKHARLVKASWGNGIPEISGLVLAGGKSTRMGLDKTVISYHGMPQRDYMMQLLHKVVPNVYLSCHPERVPLVDYKVITDTFLDLGPFGAVLSAFRFDPNAAWLVVACDFPLLDEETVTQLIGQRDPSKVATCFHDPSTGFPEPLITIWEPRAYAVLLQHLSEGNGCLRNVLISSDAKKINPELPEVLRNANTPEEVKGIREIISDRSESF